MNLQELQDVQKIYDEIKEKLAAPFPNGTVEVNTNNNNNARIPVQAYLQRLEEVAGAYWSWRLVGDPVIYERESQVQVKGILKILNAEREGIGFANFTTYSDTGKIQNLKNAILSAESDALRKACDKYRMGWKDLAPYRDWSNNPGVNIDKQHQKVLNNDDVNLSTLKCVKCQKYLTKEEEQFLADNRIKINYCKDDIPLQLLKKRG